MGNIKTKVKILTAAFCAASLMLVSQGSASRNTAFASSEISSLQEEIKKLQAENEKRRQEIASLGGDISDNESAMEMVSEQIDGVNREISEYARLISAKQEKIDEKKSEIAGIEENIASKEKEIDGKKDEISELQAENKRNLRKFAKLARALYMTDSSGSAPILSGSDDWYNYFVYSDVVRNISGQNTRFMERLLDDIKRQEKLISELNRDIENLELEKEGLHKQKEKLEADMDELEGEKSKLNDYADEKKQYLYGIAAENEELRDKVDELEKDEALARLKMEEFDKRLQELIRIEQAKGNRPAYTDGFRWPLDKEFQNIICKFGYDGWRQGQHRGIDIVGYGTDVSDANIYAAQSGTVISVYTGCPHDYPDPYPCGCGGNWGNHVVIDHGGYLSTRYAHCRDIYVSVGQFVEKGDVIATVGSSGWSTGEHLHFEVMEDGTRVDPLGYGYQIV